MDLKMVRAMGSVALLVVLWACAQPTTSKVASTSSTGKFFSNLPASTVLNGNGTFGSAVARQTGISGLVNPSTQSTLISRIKGTFTLQATISFNGKDLADAGADNRLVNPPLEIKLMPSRSFHLTGHDYLHESGVLRFANLPEDRWHLVYDDTKYDAPLISVAQPDRVTGLTRINQLGYFVSDPISVFELLKPVGPCFTYNLDLYWDTQSVPFYADIDYPDPTHRNGEYVSYTDTFSVKAREFAGLIPGETPPDDQMADYRFVIYSNDGHATRLWESSWHQPKTDTADPAQYGTVQAIWNGYSSAGSGPADAPDESVTDNQQLPAADYLWAIEFRKHNGQFPDQALNPRSYQDDFISNFYGGSQLFKIRLKIGTKRVLATPSPSPSAWMSPTPSAMPTFTPILSDPFASPGY